MARSPFPGMDPYLEQRWSDVHATLIAFIKEALQAKLPADLRARSEERILLEADGEEARDLDAARKSHRADVAVIDKGVRSFGDQLTSVIERDDTICVELLDPPLIDRFIQIIDVVNGGRLITAIEVLSPGNKQSGQLIKYYLEKLKDYFRAGVNVVEIDLLRSSRQRLPGNRDQVLPERRPAYQAEVWRPSDPGRWFVHFFPLRKPLAPIPIPLRSGEPEVSLELQPLIERVYAAGGHDDIDYTKLPVPPLSDEDEAWARTFLPTSSASGAKPV